jgi:hypothetical protein
MKKNLLLFVFLLSLNAVNSFAQLEDWAFSKPLYLTGAVDDTLRNTPISLVINTQTLVTNGQMMADGSDLRFAENCLGNNIYGYWIESGMNTESTVVRVIIDSLISDDIRSIYIFYGNPAALPQSNISNVSYSATDSVTGLAQGGVVTSQRGFRFKPNVDIYATSFGKYEPNGTTRYVTLFNADTESKVGQMQVSGAAATYSYQNLTQPILLDADSTYILALYQGGSDGYYYGPSTQIGEHLTYIDMRYCNVCDQNTFPTNTLADMHYGVPDLLYFPVNAIPSPSVSEFIPAELTTCDSIVINSVTYNETGLYNITIPNSMGCDSVIFLNLTISNSPFAGEGSSASICSNSTPTVDLFTYLSGEYAVGGTWVDLDLTGALIGSEFTTTSVSQSATYNFAYVVEGAPACDNDTAFVDLFVDICFGISSISNSDIHIFPMPATNMLTIEGIDIRSIELFTLQGTLVKEIFYPAKEKYSFDISFLSEGVYNIKVNSKTGTSNHKLIKY